MRVPGWWPKWKKNKKQKPCHTIFDQMIKFISVEPSFCWQWSWWSAYFLSTYIWPSTNELLWELQTELQMCMPGLVVNWSHLLYKERIQTSLLQVVKRRTKLKFSICSNSLVTQINAPHKAVVHVHLDCSGTIKFFLLPHTTFFDLSPSGVHFIANRGRCYEVNRLFVLPRVCQKLSGSFLPENSSTTV